MEYRRYGKFMLKDYWKLCIVAISFTIFGILAIINEVSILECIIWLIVGWIPLIQIILPHRETFIMKADSFIVKKGKKRQEINCPNNIIAIISRADICSELAKRVSL